MSDFVLHSKFEPTGDQPEAIRALTEGIREGAAGTGAPRRHRQRQDVHHGQRNQKHRPPHPHPLPQQDARRPTLQRDEGVFPRKRCGILRFLLRLLSARGLHRLDRHLYRKRPRHQRRHRPLAPRRHQRAALGPQRRRGRLERELHLRYGQSVGVLRKRDFAPPRRDVRPRAPCCADWSTASTPATTWRQSRANFA